MFRIIRVYLLNITALKLGFAFALLAWMITDGQLNLSQLSVFGSKPQLVVLAFLYWFIGPVILASIRWRILLRCAGYRLTVARSIRLQLIGFFFTTAMPGSLGGDFVKVFYLIRDNPGKEKTAALWAILFDRIIGMCGLFLVGAFFISINLQVLWGIAVLRPVIVLVYGYILMFAIFMVVLKLLKPVVGRQQDQLGIYRSIIGRVYQFMTACRIYHNHFPAIFLSLLLSTVSHGLSFVFFVALAWTIWGHGGGVSELAAIFPIGMLITTLPLSPGGLGVGHLAFEQLFTLVGLIQGANIYNAYFVSQLLLNITGVVAYLGKGTGRAQVSVAEAGTLGRV